MTLPKPYYHDEDAGITIYHADCRDILPLLPKVDLVLTDPPYGTTAIRWDNEVEFMDIVLQISPIVAITSSQPYTSKMVCKYLKYFKHEWIWEKNKPTNIFQSDYAPMKQHETVLVFAKTKYVFNPQKIKRSEAGQQRAYYVKNPSNTGKREYIGNFKSTQTIQYDPNNKNPYSIIYFNNEVGLHPTQKPVALFKYFISTYSNQIGSILDPFLGSGTTAVACKQLHRKCIGIEIEERYAEIAVKRLGQGVLPI